MVFYFYLLKFFVFSFLLRGDADLVFMFIDMERFFFFFLQTQFFFCSIFFLFFMISMLVFLLFWLQDVLLIFTVFDLIFSFFAVVFALLSLHFCDPAGMLFFFVIVAVVGCELSIVLGLLVSFSRRSSDKNSPSVSPTVTTLRFSRG